MLQRGRARAGAECVMGMATEQANYTSFNGAAPARARNVDELAVLRQPPRRFNGAAPARARNAEILRRDSGAWSLASTGPRPRGRGMVMPADHSQTRAMSLQRGRARAGAEWSRPILANDAVKLLQRGRARAGAECSQIQDRRKRHLARFNGAAPARARNVLSCNPFRRKLATTELRLPASLAFPFSSCC